MNSVQREASSGVWNLKCKMQSVEWGVGITECGGSTLYSVTNGNGFGH